MPFRRNIRFYVLIAAGLLSLLIYGHIAATIPAGSLQTVKLVQDYGYTSLILLYITLVIGPLTHYFVHIPHRKLITGSRRAFGVSMWYYALLHVVLSFFGQLGGFRGLQFLGTSYLIAVTIGAIALLIFSVQAALSLDRAIMYLGHRKWKTIQQLVYLAGILTLVHTFMLGTAFSDLTSLPAQLLIAGLAILLILHALASDKWLRIHKKLYPTFGPFTLGVISAVVGVMLYLFVPVTNGSGGLSFNIHAAHIQLAQQAQQGASSQKIGKIDISRIPGLNGDRSKRYTMGMTSDPVHPQPGQSVNLTFTVTDASSGAPVTLYRVLYAKLIHLIITDNTLTYFSHIHPEQHSNTFTITTAFPKDGIYHLYTETQPFGGIDQQFAFTLPVGNPPDSVTVDTSDTKPTKTFGNYEVTVDTHGQLLASKMSLGEQTITFTLRDVKTKLPLKTLQPYLASFGHLTMVNMQSYDFLHVHPFSLTIPKDTDRSGPSVDFLPIGIYGAFKPGIYKAFGEFNIDNQVITTDFLLYVN